jgi:hypothetical protein
MECQYNQFIGMYTDVYPDGFCDHMISEFDRVLFRGLCGNRQDEEGTAKTRKQDNFYFLNLRQHVLSSFNDEGALPVFMGGLQRCFDEYTAEYDSLKDVSLQCTSVKMQKTIPGAGYHVWHAEQGNGDASGRCLTYILYLNDIEEAGETEFLYQQLRIPPKKNSLVVWPAAFTHTHRGNVVHGNSSKYIITGWFYLD